MILKTDRIYLINGKKFKNFTILKQYMRDSNLFQADVTIQYSYKFTDKIQKSITIPIKVKPNKILK